MCSVESLIVDLMSFWYLTSKGFSANVSTVWKRRLGLEAPDELSCLCVISVSREVDLCTCTLIILFDYVILKALNVSFMCFLSIQANSSTVTKFSSAVKSGNQANCSKRLQRKQLHRTLPVYSPACVLFLSMSLSYFKASLYQRFTRDETVTGKVSAE